MSQIHDPKSELPQSNNTKPSLSETTTSPLKLVVSNPAPPQASPNAAHPKAPNAEFSVKVCSRGHDLYEMNIQDPFHDLECDLILDIERVAGKTTMACHFPAFLGESNKFLDEDEALYGIIVVQFQMNVMEQLFIFCANYNTSQLTLYMDDAQAKGFGVYQDFLSHCGEALTENEKQDKMVISTDQKMFDKWRRFMQKINFELEQGLWREQRLNPVIRRYLKSRAHG